MASSTHTEIAIWREGSFLRLSDHFSTVVEMPFLHVERKVETSFTMTSLSEVGGSHSHNKNIFLWIIIFILFSFMGMGRNGDQPRVFKFMYQRIDTVCWSCLRMGWRTRVAALIYRNAVHSVVRLEVYLPCTVPLEESAFFLTMAPVDRVVGVWEQKLKCEDLWS